MSEFISRYIPKERVWRMEIQETKETLAGAYLIKKNSGLKLCYITSRQHGIGRQLLSSIINFARENGYNYIEGDFTPVPEFATSARQMYEDAGFTIDNSKKIIHLDL